jgi:hypothetical protein
MKRTILKFLGVALTFSAILGCAGVGRDLADIPTSPGTWQSESQGPTGEEGIPGEAELGYPQAPNI